jgi:ribosomal protein S6--L-glutamate ligase
VVDLDEDYRRAAIQATQVMGLRVAGVDLLESHEGPKVMEINSSPGFEGLEKATRLDIARIILEYAVRYARRHGGGSWRS